MSEWSCFLVYVSNGSYLRKCAIKARGAPEFFMEMEHRAWFHAHLPAHVRDHGHIVLIDPIDDVRIADEAE